MPEAPQQKRPRALIFDVFGTVVDWRGSIIDAARRIVGGVDSALEELADSWARGYAEQIHEINAGRRRFAAFDQLLAESLDVAAADRTALQRRELLAVWRQLEPWPDSVRGLERLRTKLWLATLSNGNAGLLKDLSANVGLGWDEVLSIEPVRLYKPRREVYEFALDELGIPASCVMMVASHAYDLAAAHDLGFQTAFVHRPAEYGADRPAPAGFADATLVCDGLADLARKLGV
jgi:2-haloacid dehalogenase